MQNMAQRLTRSNPTMNGSSGAFMGFESSSEESENSDVEKGDTSKPVDEVSRTSFDSYVKDPK